MADRPPGAGAGREVKTAKRVYTTYGKKTLEAGEPWVPVETPAQGGWRFFKAGVEMR